MIERIADATDPRLAPYAAVADAAALRRDGLFVAEGRLVVERLLEDGRFAVQSVAATTGSVEALRRVLDRRPDVRVYLCEPAILRVVLGFDFHRGCLALAHRPRREMPIEEAARATRVLALEGVTDPDNVGGLFRAAFAFGVEAVILDRATADPLYRKAIRTSMAATLRLPFVRVDALIEALAVLRAGGLRIVALTPHPDALPLADYTARDAARVALLAGSEGFGLGAALLREADVTVRIPMDPRADSLNVVTAASIALYALSETRRPGEDAKPRGDRR